MFETLLHYMVGNEHWKASGKYISRVVKNTRDSHDTNVSTVALEDAERLKVESKLGRHTDRKQWHKGTYSLHTVLRIVAEERNGQWTPSYDAVHKWITEGRRWYGQVNAVRERRNAIHVTEEGLTQVRAIVEAERKHRRLHKKARDRNFLDAYQKLLQRKKTSDGTPDWEAIEAHIDRRSSKVAAEDVLSLEDQIAEYQARLAEAEPGSDEWIDAHDALQRLRQMQKVSDT